MNGHLEKYLTGSRRYQTWGRPTSPAFS